MASIISPLTVEACYPAREALLLWQDTSAAVTWSGVAQDSWDCFMTHLGATGVTAIPFIAAIPPHLAMVAIEAWKAEKYPAPFEQVRLGLAFNALRFKLGMELVDVIPPPPSAAPPVLPLVADLGGHP